ncbi:hypothetical protein HBI56_189290 [Parastagonospora nodorum]|nr:hypothetical protein HBI56_189290 [Parastagonospora nodorum]
MLTECLHTGAAGFQLDADWPEEQTQEQWTPSVLCQAPQKTVLGTLEASHEPARVTREAFGIAKFHNSHRGRLVT